MLQAVCCQGAAILTVPYGLKSASLMHNSLLTYGRMTSELLVMHDCLSEQWHHCHESAFMNMQCHWRSVTAD